ncbi:MAG: tRNA pseudouridine(54/55) synthase Pus10 [Methanomicrobiaceae archaeon]|nr:tRNA pseudouridine(54/55) synthase Pus10 [Methanomicrobiaceae archaeon]
MEMMNCVGPLLEFGPICDHCLGRMFGKRSHGLANDERGRALRITYALDQNIPYAEERNPCWICGNLFDGTALWAGRIAEALDGIEYDTFLVGCRVPPLIAESEELVWSDLSLPSPEPIKAEFNREVGKAVSAITGKSVDFVRPDIVVICNIPDETLKVQINSLLVYGRYKKLIRGIPQTRWHCRVCRGKGCERCNFTGKMYADSVEELIGRPVIACTHAEDAILHGAGREDIDALMLGTGRPFVLEVVSPRTRSIDLADLAKVINRSAEGKVSVVLDHWSDRHEVETIKSEKAHKKYSILVEVDGAFSIDDVRNALKSISGATIDQRTPERVSHRRADKVRKRRVITIECIGVEDGRFFIDVVGEAGLYIKELISGDNGRTTPSLSEILGARAHVVTLDVVMVEGVVPEKAGNDEQ